jgi:hypothetical protein
MRVVLDRFVRVVGGQVLAVGIVSTIAFLNSGDIDPQFSVYATVLGAALTAVDKWCRYKGWYGTSLETANG